MAAPKPKNTKPKTTSKGSNKETDVLLQAIDQIQTQYGTGAITKLVYQKGIKIPHISTGSISFDIALGVGGFPRGRIIEIYGPESSGKTTVCSHIIANCQAEGMKAAFIDVEHALDPKYLEKIGVNLKELYVSQPSSGEEALNICETLLKTKSLGVIVVDSVAALVPQAELDGEMGASHIGLQARLMSQAMRKLTAIIEESNCCVIFTNQIREKVGVVYGSPEVTSGGRALKFYASIRVNIRRIGMLKDAKDLVYGNRTRVKIIKNKVAAPFTEAEFDILYAEGISKEGSLIDIAGDLGVIKKKGSWFSYEGETIGQGKESIRKLLKDSPEKYKAIETEVYKLLEGGEEDED